MKKALFLCTCMCILKISVGQNLFGPMLLTQSIDSVKVVYRGYDSLAVARYFSVATNALVQTTFANGIANPVSTTIQNITGVFSDTVGVGGLMSGSIYTITTVVVQIDSSADTVVVLDSTLAGIPTPVDIGPMISVSSISSYSALLTVPYQRNGGGTVFVTWQDSVSGGAWSYLTTHQISGVNPTGNDTLTVFQNPNTSRWYRAIGINQMFPLIPDTSQSVVVVTLPLLANPPIVDSVIVTSITSQGGIVTITVSADSIGGVLFVETTCGGNTTSYTPIAYSAGTHSYQVTVTACGPLQTVAIAVSLISSNTNWSTVSASATFQTSSGPFEVAITSCFAIGAVASVDVTYSSGGYANNSFYLYAFNTWDINFNNAIAFSQIYSGVPQAVGGTYTMSITTGLSPGTTYLLKAYLFNALGQIESLPCTVTMPGTTSISENEKFIEYLFFSEGVLNYSTKDNDELTVCDMTGHVLFNENISYTGSIPMNYPRGMYFVRKGNNKPYRFYIP